MSSSFTLGDLQFAVRRSDRRRTLGLTVERDGSLVVSAPPGVPDARLERFARQKRLWIYQKLAAKEALPPALPSRKYVNGEGFPYLGRSHRLLLVAEQDAPVKLEAGRFKMRCDEAASGRSAMIRWYTARAQAWLQARVQRHSGRARVACAAVTVQDLGFRWGSCGKGARLYFHWQSILLPVPIGGLQVITPTYLIFTADGNAAQILAASGLYLFGFTYLYAAFNILAGLDGRALGYFSGFVAVCAVVFAGLHFWYRIDGVRWGDNAFGVIWLHWAFLWGLFFVLLGLGKESIARYTGAVAAIQGWVTGAAPSFLLLTDSWSPYADTYAVVLSVFGVVVFGGLYFAIPRLRHPTPTPAPAAA